MKKPLSAVVTLPWPFPDSTEMIECMLCEDEGMPGNMFMGNYNIVSHIVSVHNEFCNCAHCNCSLPSENGIFYAHMKHCLPCPGNPTFPFTVTQCPSFA